MCVLGEICFKLKTSSAANAVRRSTWSVDIGETLAFPCSLHTSASSGLICQSVYGCRMRYSRGHLHPSGSLINANPCLSFHSPCTCIHPDPPTFSLFPALIMLFAPVSLFIHRPPPPLHTPPRRLLSILRCLRWRTSRASILVRWFYTPGLFLLRVFTWKTQTVWAAAVPTSTAPLLPS